MNLSCGVGGAEEPQSDIHKCCEGVFVVMLVVTHLMLVVVVVVVAVKEIIFIQINVINIRSKGFSIHHIFFLAT